MPVISDTKMSHKKSGRVPDLSLRRTKLPEEYGAATSAESHHEQAIDVTCSSQGEVEKRPGATIREIRRALPPPTEYHDAPLPFIASSA